MSRFADGFDGVTVAVQTDADGVPLIVDNVPVADVLSHHREWIGVLEGEPQRDVWRVQVGRGLCELHFLSHPNEENVPKDAVGGAWLLMRWED